jgi:hypothetical protein
MLQNLSIKILKMKNKSFIICISNKFNSVGFTALIEKVELRFSKIATVWKHTQWTAPREYEDESGQGLETRIIILDKMLDSIELVELKKFLMKYETETSVNSNRVFNLNPGYIDNDGLFLLSRKPNFQRGREHFGGNIWSEKQYKIVDGKLMQTTNTFSELQDKTRLTQFQILLATGKRQISKSIHAFGDAKKELGNIATLQNIFIGF